MRAGRQIDNQARPETGTPGLVWRLVSLGLSPDEHRALQQHPWPCHCEVLALPDCGFLIDYANRNDRVIVVVDTDAIADQDVRSILLASVSSGARLVCRVSLTPRAARQIAACGQAPVSLTVSLRRFDRIQQSVTSVLADADAGDATAPIMARLVDSVDMDKLVICAGAAIIGRRAGSVAEWSAVTNESVRSLERRIANCGLPHAKRLLTWMLVLHTSWRVQHRGWPLKRAASEAGLPTTRALASRMRRVLSHEKLIRLHRVSVGEMFELFAGELSPPNPFGNATLRSGDGE